MKSDNRIKQFRNIAQNYEQYQNLIKAVNDRIVMVEHNMENVHSIDFEKTTGTFTFDDRSMIELIEKKTVLEKEKQYYKDLISWIDAIIDSLESGAIKALIWMSCIKRIPLSSIAEEYNMSRDYLYKVRRAYLFKALSDEVMASLELIQQSAPHQTESR